MADDLETKSVESLEERQSSPSDALQGEDLREGKGQLVSEHKQYMAYLKDGGTSGISAEFGKPMLISSEVSEDKLPKDPGESQLEKKVSRGVKDNIPESVAVREAQATLVNKDSSQEEKVKAATEMAKLGEKSFTGPDGKRYDINLKEGADGSQVTVTTRDRAGVPHAVLQGDVKSDGTVTKSKDARGKEVPFESSWASTNLKDSPLVGAKEKAAEVQPSEENKHLQTVLKEKGIEPPNTSPADRLKLAEQHGKLEETLKKDAANYEREKAIADAKNAPLKAQLKNIEAQQQALDKKSTDAIIAASTANGELAEHLKDAGVGDGSRLTDTDNPETYKKLRSDIDSTVTSPEKRAQLKKEVDALEKSFKHANEVTAQVDKQIAPLDERQGQLLDQQTKNNEKVFAAQKEYNKDRNELRNSEQKIAESKFADDLKEIDKLPKEKREAVYKSLEQIANDSGGEPNHLSAEQRQKLVEQTAHQIAHPESITQGNKGTCGLASTEFELAKNHPEKYAQIVADLSTKGKFDTAHGGMTIAPENINGKNDKGEYVAQDDGNPDRSLTSKIFQTAAANKVLEYQAKESNPPETPSKYVTVKPGEQIPDNDPDFNPSQDTGERIIGPNGELKDWSGASETHIAELTSELTGDRYEVVSVVKNRDLSKPAEAKAAEKDFLDAMDKNEMPIKVAITAVKGDHTGMETEADHEITITRVDKGPPAMVYYYNPAGAADHNYPTGKPVPLKDFLKSMQTTKTSDGKTHAEGHLVVKNK
jgi:hypothetical protein